MRTWTSIAVVLALLAVGAPDAAAQEDKAAARKLLRKGDRSLRKADRLRERGREERAIEAYEEALVHYRAAYDAYASPKIYFPIAEVEERLGLDLGAYGHYQTILDEVDEIDDNLRAQVEERLSELEKRLLLVTFTVEPDGATVSVDGDVVGVSPLERPVPLFPGEYPVVISKKGYRSYEGQVAGGPGEIPEEVVVLQSERNRQPDDDDDPLLASGPTEDGGSRRPGRLGVMVGASATGTFAIGATVTGILALSKKSDFDDADTQEARDSAADSGETLALTTDILIGAAVVAGAVTAYYYFGVYRGSDDGVDERAAAPAQTWVAPYASVGGAGLAVGGRF